MTFWLIALGAVAVVALFLLRPIMRRRAVDEAGAENLDLQVYRDQLAEVDSDLNRGVLSPDEAGRTRTEISRRILDADKLGHEARIAGRAPKYASRIMAGLVVVALLAGSAEIYRRIGANGDPDLPLSLARARMAEAQANRPSQATAEARAGDITSMAAKADPAYRALVAKLRKAVASRPDDLRGQQLLAEHEARLGNFAAAQKAQAKVIAIIGNKATAKDYTDLAELMIIAAGGYVSPEAERTLADAIDLDRNNPRARYYSGLDLAQNGRADLAYKLWMELLAEGPADAPWIKPIREQIADVARMAGRRPVAPATSTAPGPAAPGPTNDQIKAAGNLSAADRQDLIRTMVARLSGRLETEGGKAGEWARLINAYGVLGETGKARETVGKARIAHAGDVAALAIIDAAALKAGVDK